MPSFNLSCKLQYKVEMERRCTGTSNSAREISFDESHRLRVIDNEFDDGKTRKRTQRRIPELLINSVLSRFQVTKSLKFGFATRAALLSFIIVACFTAFQGSYDAIPTGSIPFSDMPAHPFISPQRIHKSANGTSLMDDAGYQARPRTIGFYFRDSKSDSWIGVQRLDSNLKRRLTHAEMDLTFDEVSAQVHLLDSKDYKDNMRDELEEGDCVAQFDWQTMSYPTCNSLHELDFNDLRPFPKSFVRVNLVGNGYWRDVWAVKDVFNKLYALKTMRIRHDWVDRNYDRHRRDALASERLTSSKNIVDVYGYCGNSGIFEYGSGGDIETMLWYSKDHWNATERLIVAYQVATAIADMHSYPDEDHPSIVHTDISTSQFIFINGRYKLNDFNRCRFIPIDKNTNKPCGFKVGNNPGTFRSPEEYRYAPETEKIDIYSMGNIFFCLITEEWPFEKEDMKLSQKKIMDGERPHILSKFETSTEPAYKILIKLTRMCWKQTPKERPSAKAVADIIEAELRAMGIEQDNTT